MCHFYYNSLTFSLITAVVRVFFDQERYQGTENSGPVEVCVRREGDATESFTINVATANSSPVQAQGTIKTIPISYNYDFFQLVVTTYQRLPR